MKVKKIVRLLQRFLDKDKKRTKQELAAIDELLKRLEDRRDRLQHKLLKQKRTCKQKRMKAELKIVEMKLKNARKRRKTIAKAKKVE
ncbi:MAG: hypothetical protein AB2598_11735 [Candidatus Thiodiazotropha sp.]